MAKKWFVVSDVHSFYVELKDALFEAGFRKKNKDHILIVVGDLFDRGPSALETYKYITSIPKCRRILIRGNHEDLYEELLRRDSPKSHDWSNMTVDTFLQIAGFNESDLHERRVSWNYVKEQVKNHPITSFIQSDEWINYYELGPFVFTHSFVPVKVKEKYKFAAKIYSEFELPEHCFEANPDWRDANDWDWYIARWGAPHRKFKEGLFAEDKTLVVGHWHTSAFFEELKSNYDYYNIPAPIYFSKGLIGLDGGVYFNASHHYIHPQNVLVIDENWTCYDKFGQKLKELPDPIIRETISYSDLTEEEKKQLK